MARMRSIKPEFWQDEDLAELPRDARLLYIGLWNVADEHGRLRGDPRYVKGQLFPYDDDLLAVHVDQMLTLLEGAGKLVRYRAPGGTFLFLPNLARHQRLDSEKVPSRLPYPPDREAMEGGDVNPQVSTGTDESAKFPDSSGNGADQSGLACARSLKHVAGGMEHVAGGNSRAPKTSASEDADFDRFWSVYPRKDAKGGARKAWTAARKKVAADVIVSGASRYRDSVRNTEPRFVCTPAKWLNDERWGDESLTAASNGRPPATQSHVYFNDLRPGAYDEYQLHGKPGDDELS